MSRYLSSTVSVVKPPLRGGLLAFVEEYCLMEFRRLAGPAPRAKPTVVEMSMFPEAKLSRGLVSWKLEELARAREVDLAIFLFCKLATAVKGTVRLNANQTGKAEGKGRFYPRLQIGRGRHSLMRIIENSSDGEVVRESKSNHRLHIPEAMKTAGTTRITKGRQTRKDAIEDICNSWGESGAGSETTHAVEVALWTLLIIADAHALERATT